MKLIPLGDTIIAEIIEEKSKSATYRPETEKEDKKKPERGRVVAVGEDCKFRDKIKKGDVIYFEKFGVEWIMIRDRWYAVGAPHLFFCIEK